ncbi:MAG: HemK/PrmC family methyltransferase [Coriobacteriia bacterium]|nr:HemK/PrmC family methyltransferase [Coriobacteriia bacterium]
MAEENTWTIKSTLDWCEGYLERKGDQNPRLSAQWLMSEATGLSRIQLYANFDRPLTMEERDVMRGYVTRRGKGEPLQYITGEVGFRYITVKVRPGVLIPRPETEVLVSEALALLPAAERRVARDSLLNEYDGAALLEALAEAGAGEPAEGGESPAPEDAPASEATEPEPLVVADICTGSGCIACSMASERPDLRVIATDISPEAVALAQDNVDALGLADRVTVAQGDLGDAVVGVAPELIGKLDVVVSNPPYVPTAVMEQIPAEVADYEPALALDGGADGLDLFRRLLVFCGQALRPGGGFAFELHETCLDDAADLARSAGFANVRVVYDLTNRPRVLTGLRPLQ